MAHVFWNSDNEPSRSSKVVDFLAPIESA